MLYTYKQTLINLCSNLDRNRPKTFYDLQTAIKILTFYQHFPVGSSLVRGIFINFRTSFSYYVKRENKIVLKMANVISTGKFFLFIFTHKLTFFTFE